VTLRDGSRVVYRYTNSTFAHHLSEIYDNAGVKVLTAQFDAEGRLDELVDASGHATHVSFDMTLGGGLSLSRVHLPEGRLAAEVRDSRGNLVRSGN